jgi:hypothetical protein
MHVSCRVDFRPWRWKRYVSAKRRFMFGPHDAIYLQALFGFDLNSQNWNWTSVKWGCPWCTRPCKGAQALAKVHTPLQRLSWRHVAIPINSQISRTHNFPIWRRKILDVCILLKCNLTGPPLWSSCQSSWLQTEVSGSIPGATRFSDVAVGLERGPLCLVTINEELLERQSSGSGLENWD